MTKLKERREALDMTQLELAAKSGVSISQINEIESGRCKPRVDTAAKLATAVGGIIEDYWPTAEMLNQDPPPKQTY